MKTKTRTPLRSARPARPKPADRRATPRRAAGSSTARKPASASRKHTAAAVGARKASGSAARARAAAKPAASGAKPSARGKRAAPRKAVSARKPSGNAARTRAAARASSARGRVAVRASSARGTSSARPGDGSRWLSFVEQHGVVLASARGPVPSVAEAVAGQPIVGSWWAHPKGKAIFAALSELDDSDDVRCFKLVDGKVTFVHRRVWPALTRLASDGLLAAARVASIQQEHMPTGEHRNLVTPFPDWVPDDVARAATALTVDDARAQLGAWI